MSLVLFLVALLPMLATGILGGSRLSSSWGFRDHARLVADDAARLQVVASARALLGAVRVPVTAVTYAAGLGIDTSALEAILEPEIPFDEQLALATASIAEFPHFSSPRLRDDVTELQALILAVSADTVSYADANAFMLSMRADIDSLWFDAYDKLQADISAWRSSGSFGVHASTLIQTYQAFVSGADLVEKAAFLVLQGVVDADARQELIEADGVYRVAISQFAGRLSPLAQAAWDSMRADPSNQQFEATIQQAVKVAVAGDPPPFAGDLAAAGAAMAPLPDYVIDLNDLVVAASQDLQDSALEWASDATGQFAKESVVVVLLVAAAFAGVIVAARVLTRPLTRLAATAKQVHDGDFDLDRLPDTGPREIAATTRAFNDMASTLKAVESTAVALAAEDFSHPELFVPLPGRTGNALQATIDSLAARIRDREQQRQLLNEAATHDQVTGLFNRAAVIDYLSNDVARRRQAGETVAVLFMDLDGLKRINDTYGHEIGDAAVKATATAILQATGICDVVGRLGGDEFLVVLCHDHSSDADAVAERVNHNLARHTLPVHNTTQPNHPDHDTVLDAVHDHGPLHASVGVAVERCDTDTDPMNLVRQADAAMYQAKRTARATRDQLEPTHT